MTQKINRREFLSKSAKGVAAVGAVTMFAPAINVLGANEKLQIGFIGPGGRGRSLMRDINKLENVEIVAVADTFTGWMEQGVAIAKEKAKNVRGYGTYKALLDNEKKLDAIVIATPEHSHSKHIIAACEAGLDVYTEKPMTHTWKQAAEVVKVVRLNNRILQVGTQRRSSDVYMKAREIIKSGKLGKVTQVCAYWYRNSKDSNPQWRYNIPKEANESNVNWREFLGEAPWDKFDLNRYFQWRCYWEYSQGIAGDLMFHQTDAINMMMETTFPKSAMAMGQIYRWNELERSTPDTWNAIIEYPQNFVVNYNCMFSNEHYGLFEKVLGSDATLEIEGARTLRVFAEKEDQRMQPVEELTYETQMDSHTRAHLANFFECVKTRQKPNCDAQDGFHSAVTSDMTVQSHFSGRRVYWDFEREEITTH